MITTIKKQPKRRGLKWLLVSVAIASGVAGYYYLNPEALPDWAARTDMGRDLQATQVYRWRDADGAWHVSDTPPPPGTPFEVQEYARDTNVLPLPPALQRE